jgi:hypothetical protein
MVLRCANDKRMRDILDFLCGPVSADAASLARLHPARASPVMVLDSQPVILY